MEKRTYPIKILGRQIGIQSSANEDYVRRVAGLVADRVDRIREASQSADPVEVAVLAALNLADEYMRSTEEMRALDDELGERTLEMCRRIDAVLETRG